MFQSGMISELIHLLTFMAAGLNEPRQQFIRSGYIWWQSHTFSCSSNLSFQFILILSNPFFKNSSIPGLLQPHTHTRTTSPQPHPTSPPIRYMSTMVRLVTVHRGSLMFLTNHVYRDSNSLHYFFKVSKSTTLKRVNVSTTAFCLQKSPFCICF